MREVFLMLALAFAVPAHAQYTISFSGTAIYVPSESRGDVNSLVATNGTSIAWSNTVVIDGGTIYNVDLPWVLYSGHTTNITLNGNVVPLTLPYAQVQLFPHSGHEYIFYSGSNGSPNPSSGLSVWSALAFYPPSFSNNEIPGDVGLYWQNSTIFNVGLQSDSNTYALYRLSLTGFSVTGTQPPLTIYQWPDDGSVPEPSAWAMMIAGFACVGARLRRRRSPRPLSSTSRRSGAAG